MSTKNDKYQSPFKHPEAFRLMNYRCDECGHRETLWNSRDGVTPFCIPCSKCNDPMGMTHVDWHLDHYAPYHQMSLTNGQRYFADMTKVRARELANRNADMLVSRGDIEQNERNQTAVRMFKNYYGDGHEPDILEAA